MEMVLKNQIFIPTALIVSMIGSAVIVERAFLIVPIQIPYATLSSNEEWMLKISEGIAEREGSLCINRLICL